MNLSWFSFQSWVFLHCELFLREHSNSFHLLLCYILNSVCLCVYPLWTWRSCLSNQTHQTYREESLYQWQLLSSHLSSLVFLPLNSSESFCRRCHNRLVWGGWTNYSQDQSLAWWKNYVAWESGTGQRRSGLPSVEGLLLATAPQIQQGRERTESQIPFFENLPLSWSRLDKLLSVGQVLPQKRGSKLDFKLVVSLVDRPKLFEGLVGELEHVFFLIKLPKQYSRCIFRLIWSNL